MLGIEKLLLNGSSLFNRMKQSATALQRDKASPLVTATRIRVKIKLVSTVQHRTSGVFVINGFKSLHLWGDT